MIDVIGLLEKNSDEEYKKFHNSLVPGMKNCYGVRIPTVRKIADDILREDWREFLSTEPHSQEELILKAIVIQKAKMDMKERLEYADGFVPSIDNWAISDTFCGKWKIGKEDRRLLWDYCKNLMESDEEFKMRVGIVMMMNNHLDDDHIRDILETSVKYYHPGYYYRMGAAWCISFCYIKYPELTEECMFSGKMDSDIMKKAIQKICDSHRVDKNSKERLKAAKKDFIS